MSVACRTEDTCISMWLPVFLIVSLSLSLSLSYHRLDRVVTPLLGTAYESQLASKTAQIRQALQKAAYLIGKEESNPVGFVSPFVYFPTVCICNRWL